MNDDPPETIYLQVCKNCREIQAVFQFKEDEPYPVTEEWMEECYLGRHINEFLNDTALHVEYIGFCCVECDIEFNGWLI